MSSKSAHPAQIMRIDPANGDRELVWIEQPIYHSNAVLASQCHNGSTVDVDSTTNGNRRSLQRVMNGHGLTMAPNGDFFLGVQQVVLANGPRGMVRISADGLTCEWVTRSECKRGRGDKDRRNRGDIFFDPYDNNLVIVHGIWGFVRVEIATGNPHTFSR